MNNLCRISYASLGAPLSIILTEASVRTTCDLTTYDPEYAEEIPFDRSSVVLKTIMGGSWLHDALSELSSTTPEKLTMYAKMVRGKPFFAISATGTLGSARVEFNNEPRPSAFRMPAPTRSNFGDDAREPQTNLLETFILSDPDTVLRSSYKFALVQKAARAMAVAKKVSVRMDAQGVLSLQFMVDVEAAPVGGNMGGGAVNEKLSFVDFLFVPMIEEEGDEADGAEGDVDETLMMNGDEQGENEDDDML
jgi:cell cycle checkpoint protein